MITYTTVRANGKTHDNLKRRPAEGHASATCDINSRYTIRPVKHDTKISIAIIATDWDATSSNDYLAKFETTLDISSVWGLDNGRDGTFVEQIASGKGEDAPRLSTVRFDFSVSRPGKIDPNEDFREQGWWRFDNFPTA